MGGVVVLMVLVLLLAALEGRCLGSCCGTYDILCDLVMLHDIVCVILVDRV